MSRSRTAIAVHSVDIAAASPDSPISLRVVGMVAAGSDWQGQVCLGEAVRILSGAPIPEVAEEFTRLVGDSLFVVNDAHPGRNILFQGSDVRHGEMLVDKGVQLTPPMVGLLAAAGYSSIPIVRLPRIAILATGDEVITQGEQLLKSLINKLPRKKDFSYYLHKPAILNMKKG
jgi:molybdopterin molybdotransferase